MDKYTYLLLDFVFFVPLLLIIFLKLDKVIKRNIKLLLILVLLGVFLFFTVDIICVTWGAWGHSRDKVLGIFFYKSPVEELIWSILLLFISGVVVTHLAEMEEKKKPFKNLLKFSKK